MLLNYAECDELAQRAEVLKDENATLRSEVNRIRSEYEQLLSENASLKVMLSFGFVYWWWTYDQLLSDQTLTW